MDDDDDTMLSAGFAIDTSNFTSEIAQAYRQFDGMVDQVIGGMGRIETEIQGGFAMTRPNQAISTFSSAAKGELAGVQRSAEALVAGIDGIAVSFATTGSAVTREERALRQERSLTNKEIERRIAAVDKEAAAYGRTKAELRDQRDAELMAIAAKHGNTEATDRLSESLRNLSNVRKSVAEDRLAAELKAEAEAARELASAQALANGQLLERSRIEAALARTNGTSRPRATEVGATFSALAEQFAEDERQAVAFEAAMARVQARVDPGAMAIGKLKTELDEARMAFDKGRIGAEAFEQEQARVAAAAGKVYGPQRQLTGITRELGDAQRFTANETLNLYRQLGDIGTTAAMHMNPLMILVQQGPQVFDVLQQAQQRGVSAGAALAQMGKDITGYAVTGFARLAPLINPVNLLLAGTAIAVVAAVRALGSYGSAIERFETTAAGLGRTSGQTAQQLEAISEAAASAGERSIGATRDSVAAFAAAGIQGEQTLTSLAGMVDKYAKLTGQDAPAAQAALASAMQDPAKAADTFTQSLGLLTGAQYEHIKQLAAQGDQEQATSELTRILSGDIAANAHQVTGLAHVMDMLGNVVSGVSTMFGRLDQKIRAAGASYDSWLKQHAGGWAVDLFGTGNQTPLGPNANAGRNQDQVAALNASQSLNTTGMKQYNDLLAQQRVLQKGLNDTTGLTSVQIQALKHDYSAVTDTINANRTASGAWITTQQRTHLVAEAEGRLAAAHTKQEKAAAQQQLTNLRLGTQVLTQQERQTQAQDAYNKVASRYTKPKTDHHAEELARESAAIEAQIGNLYKLSVAYGVSGAAALIAEARVKAESDAIKKRGDVEAFVDRQVRLAVAERVKSSAQTTAAMREEAMRQEQLNGEVAAGNLPASEAADIMRARMADLPLLSALEAAQTLRGKEGAIAVEAATKALDEQASGDNQLASLREELRLVGATEAARVHAMATLKAEQDASQNKWTGPDASKWVKTQVDIADGQYQLKLQTDALNGSLTYQGDLLDEIATNVANAARGMADAFGEAGRAIGDTVSIYASFGAQQERLAAAHKQQLTLLSQNTNAESRDAAIRRENSLFAVKNATAQVGLYGDMTQAAKGFFKEGSVGYKAMATRRRFSAPLSSRCRSVRSPKTQSKPSHRSRIAPHAQPRPAPRASLTKQSCRSR
jgi:hypothetical protein